MIEPEPSDVLAAGLANPDPLCRHEIGCIHCRSLAARGYVLAATRAGAPPAPAIDVAVLAEALRAVPLWRYWYGTVDEFAVAIAREYDRQALAGGAGT